MERGLTTRVFPDLHTLAATAAAELARAARQAVTEHGRFRLALTGGHTVQPLYAALAATPETVPWNATHLFWGDERFVPHDDQASNYRMARDTLLHAIPIPHHQVHPIPTTPLDPDQAAHHYHETLRAEVERSGDTLFDLVLLSLGEDGHIASLFPGSPALDEHHRLALAVTGPKPPAHRITLTLPALDDSLAVWVLAAGPAKAAALAAALASHTPSTTLPSRLLSPKGGAPTWWVDEAAAGAGGAVPAS